MRYEWDEKKNQSNQAKHGLSFQQAVHVFNDGNFLTHYDGEVEGEERWQTVGLVNGVLLILVAHTVREEGMEEVIRIISARRATPQERRNYEAHVKENAG
jgi:uncharacterized DUF497 family protein